MRRGGESGRGRGTRSVGGEAQEGLLEPGVGDLELARGRGRQQVAGDGVRVGAREPPAPAGGLQRGRPRDDDGPGPRPAEADHAVARQGLHLGGGGIGDHPPALEHHGAGGELLGLVEVVGGEHDRPAALRLGVHRGPELPPGADVHARGRLVEDQQVRLGQQGQREAQPLLLAARALGDLPPREPGGPSPAQGLVDGQRIPVQGRDHGDRLPHGQVVEQPPGLQDRADPPCPHALARGGAEGAHGAVVGVGEAQDHVEEGGLAGAVGPEQRDDLAALDAHAHAVHGADALLAAPEALVDAGDVDGRGTVRRVGGARVRRCAGGREGRHAPTLLHRAPSRKLHGPRHAHDLGHGPRGRHGVPAPCPVGWSPVALTIGIVGLPNVGKSTLFNALTRNTVLAANYPFATIEPNIGVVNLPDPRLDRLAEIHGSDRILPATVSFVDIAGIVKGASEGEGLGNQFLANIREAHAIAQVVRAFDDPDVIHVDGEINPASDMETINTELILADLQTLENAIPRLEKQVKIKKADPAKLAAMQQAQTILERGDTIFGAAEKEKLDVDQLRDLSLLTAKPFIYVFNADDGVLGDEVKQQELRELVAPADAVFLDAKLESELVELDEEEAKEMLEMSGQDEPGLDKLARTGFHTLGLQTYLTAGPKESRAWTIPVGATAPQAAGVIHTDFERGFIKAEIVSFEDLDAAGSMADAKAAGKVRIEGKDYVMRDGDVVEFRTGLTYGGKK